MYTAPGIAPQNFTYINVTATSITFQWDNLTTRQANGIVRNFAINCTAAAGNSSVMVSILIVYFVYVYN